MAKIVRFHASIRLDGLFIEQSWLSDFGFTRYLPLRSPSRFRLQAAFGPIEMILFYGCFFSSLPPYVYLIVLYIILDINQVLFLFPGNMALSTGENLRCCCNISLVIRLT
jgi:hypothetical protein